MQPGAIMKPPDTGVLQEGFAGRLRCQTFWQGGLDTGILQEGVGRALPWAKVAPECCDSTASIDCTGKTCAIMEIGLNDLWKPTGL